MQDTLGDRSGHRAVVSSDGGDADMERESERAARRRMTTESSPDANVFERVNDGNAYSDDEEDDEEMILASKDPEEPLRSIEGWIIIISGVHEEAVEDDILAAFEPFGEIKNCHLNLDRRTGFVKGYSFIEYESYPSARAAIDGMSGKELCGNVVSVNWAFTR